MLLTIIVFFLDYSTDFIFAVLYDTRSACACARTYRSQRRCWWFRKSDVTFTSAVTFTPWTGLTSFLIAFRSAFNCIVLVKNMMVLDNNIPEMFLHLEFTQTLPPLLLDFLFTAKLFKLCLKIAVSIHCYLKKLFWGGNGPFLRNSTKHIKHILNWQFSWTPFMYYFGESLLTNLRVVI